MKTVAFIRASLSKWGISIAKTICEAYRSWMAPYALVPQRIVVSESSRRKRRFNGD